MVVGYNHNIKYKGEIFHIQTEDSGISNPHIITLLYRGGNIIASKKTSYADIVKMDNLNQIVEELMKEQHKDMLRRLKNSEFDARLGLDAVAETEPAAAASVSEPVAGPAAPVVTPAVPPLVPLPTPIQSQEAAPPAEPAACEPQDEVQPKKKQSLDDLIFDFLSADDDEQK